MGKSLFNSRPQQPRLPSAANTRRRDREFVDGLESQYNRNSIRVTGTAESMLPLNQAEFIVTVNSFDPKLTTKKEGLSAQVDVNANVCIKKVEDKMKSISELLVKTCSGDIKFSENDGDDSVASSSSITFPFGEKSLQPHSSKKTLKKETATGGFFASVTTTTETIDTFDGWSCSWGMRVRVIASGDDAAFAQQIAKIIDTLNSSQAVTEFSLHYSLDQASKDQLAEKVRAQALKNATSKANTIVGKLNANKPGNATVNVALGSLKTFTETSESVSRGETQNGRVFASHFNKQTNNNNNNNSGSGKFKYANSAFTFGEDVERFSLELVCEFNLDSASNDDADDNDTVATIGHFDVFGSAKKTKTTSTTFLRSNMSAYPKDNDTILTATQAAEEIHTRQKALHDALAPLIVTEDSSCDLVFSKIPRFTAYGKQGCCAATSELCVVVKQQDVNNTETSKTAGNNLRWALFYEQLYNFGLHNLTVEHKNQQGQQQQHDDSDEDSTTNDDENSTTTDCYHSLALDDLSKEAWAMAQRYATEINMEVAGVNFIEELAKGLNSAAAASATSIRSDLPSRGPGAAHFSGAGGAVQQQQQQDNSSFMSSISSSAGSSFHLDQSPVNIGYNTARAGQRVSFKFVAKK